MEIKFNLPNLMHLKRYNRNNLVYFKTEKRIRGVYALFYDNQLLYIGESVNLWQRILDHKREKKKYFTEFAFQEFDKAVKIELLIYEAIYINLYRPPWNNGLRKWLYK